MFVAEARLRQLMLDDHAHDLPLARLLNELARLPMPTIQGLLGEVRGAAGGPTLARALVSRGLLTAEEVEGLLARLGGAAAAPAAAGVPASLERIGEYRLLRRIGSGGMGNVYEAEQVTSGARCALKLANVEHDPVLRARLQREGEAQARVDAHPNVVRVLSAGEVGGRGYLVMELVTGGTLQDRIKEQPIEGEAAAEIVAQLADGLHHVHQRGVLHRDLKPANVLFDADGVPKLVDFGLARVADAQSLTQTGAVLGTPAFMSPEQARGVAGEIDARSDVYGLGAVLFACLTGRPPFREPAMLAVLAQVIREAPPDPSDLVPGVPAWVEAVCLRALAKDPGERYPDAAALAEALRSPPGVTTTATPTQRRAAPSWRGALATVAVACAAGAGAYALTRTRPVVAPGPASASSPAPDSAETGFRAALEALAQAGPAADLAPLASALAALQAERPLRGPELERLRELALDPVGPPALGPLVGALRPDDGPLQAALLKRFAQADLEGGALRALARSYQGVGERAAALAPASAGLSVALARCDLLLDAERWEEANRLVERLFADPRCDVRVRPHVALRRGRLRWVALQVEAARVDFEVSSGLGGPLEAFAWRAIALQAEGRRIVAVRWALHYLRQADPKTSARTARLFRRVALLVYWVGARLGDQASRVAAAERVVAAFPDRQHVGWRVRLAYLQGRLGDVAPCRGALEAALTRIQAGHPLADLRPRLVAALTLLQRGDREGVQRLRGVAVELDERAGLGRSFTP